MREHIVTFDYEGITHPETGEELKGVEASMQFVREFNCCILPGDILAYRGFEVNLKRRLVYYRFITDDSMDTADLSDMLQTALYDEGGLSGEFYMGKCVPFDVSREEVIVRRVTIMAESEEHAIQRATAGGTVLSCKPVNN